MAKIIGADYDQSGMLAVYVETLEGRKKFVKEREGRWISDDRNVLLGCSECGIQISTSWDYGDLSWNYCPNCGAKMDGGTDREPH